VGASQDGKAVAVAQQGTMDNNLSPLTLVRLAKARHCASRDSVLFFVGAEHRFREVTREDNPEAPPGRLSTPDDPARPKASGPKSKRVKIPPRPSAPIPVPSSETPVGTGKSRAAVQQGLEAGSAPSAPDDDWDEV
jgi:hypothetical protein